MGRPFDFETKNLVWYLAAAFFLLGFGVAFEVIPRLKSSPQPPPAESRDASLLNPLPRASWPGGSASGTLAFGDVVRLLAEAGADPSAAGFAQEFLRDPELRRIWNDFLRTQDPVKLMKLLGGSRGFTQLLVKRGQKDPRFQALVGQIGSLAAVQDVLRRAAAPADAQPLAQRRMLLSAGASPGGRPDSLAAGRGPSAVLPAWVPSGLSFMLARFSTQERGALLARLEQGSPLAEACRSASLTERCAQVVKECRGDAVCADWLSQALAPSAAGDKSRGRGPLLTPPASPLSPPSGEAPTEGVPSAPPGAATPYAPAPCIGIRAHPITGRCYDCDGIEVACGGSPPATNSPPPPTKKEPETEPPPETVPRMPVVPPKRPPGPPQPNPSPTPAPRLPPGCFAAGTKIRAPSGEVPIEALRPGDLILSADPAGGTLIAASVLRVSRAESASRLRLTLSGGGYLEVTGEHPFYDPVAARYRPARELRPGDALYALDAAGRLGRVPLLSVADSRGPAVPVFNLTVNGEHHNYLAGGVLVHNKPEDSPRLEQR